MFHPGGFGDYNYGNRELPMRKDPSIVRALFFFVATEFDSLKFTGKKSATPVVIVKELAAGFTFVRGSHDYEGV